MSALQRARSHPFFGYALSLGAALCWASGGLLAKWLFTAPTDATAGWVFPPLGIQISPEALSGGRALLSFVIIIPTLALLRPRDLRVHVRDLPFFAAFGILGLAAVHFTYFKAISLTNASTAILLEYLAPILVLVYAVVFERHRPNWKLPVAVALSTLGCAFVVGAFSPGGLVVSPLGIVWGLLSAVAFASYSILGARAATRFRSFTTLAYGLGFAALFWLVTLGPAAVIDPLRDPRVLAAVTGMALISTILPFGAFLTALRLIPPTHATTTATLEPFAVAVGEAILFLSVLSGSQMIGGLLVITAIILIQLRDRTVEEETLPAFPPADEEFVE